jgi:hypothetical protein
MEPSNIEIIMPSNFEKNDFSLIIEEILFF